MLIEMKAPAGQSTTKRVRRLIITAENVAEQELLVALGAAVVTGRIFREAPEGSTPDE